MTETTCYSERGQDVSEEIKVAVCIPAREMSHTWFAQSLALAMGYMGKNQPEVDMRLYVNNGTILSEQRQALAKLALLGRSRLDRLVRFGHEVSQGHD